jgi:hypothetical protein
MKKVIIAAAVIFTASFVACTKDNSVKTTSSVTTKKLADDGNKQDIGQADGNKQDIGQADGN